MLLEEQGGFGVDLVQDTAHAHPLAELLFNQYWDRQSHKNACQNGQP